MTCSGGLLREATFPIALVLVGAVIRDLQEQRWVWEKSRL